RVGLSQTGEEFRSSFHNLLDEQYVSLSLSLPIFDWGTDFVGCHPCANTSSLKIPTKSVFETFLNATGHVPIVLDIPRE
ncbi:MAG: hypothetical protein IKA43_06930, partial [Clostridia bacterium]|nr:hypothetical protein [Clostridia bacterium]